MNDERETVLIYAINRTEKWWRAVGDSLGSYRSFIVSDIRGKGDFCVVDDFYKSYRIFYRSLAEASHLLSKDTVSDIVARCRVLRFLPERRARAMALAMAEAFAKVLDASKPSVIIAFPIDRYVSDVLEHVGRARGIPFFELTASALPGMAMLMQKGKLCKTADTPPQEIVDEYIEKVATPLFTPFYVQNLPSFNSVRFLKIFFYFRLRGLVFRLMSWIKRDPLNLHYVDAQSFLGHKPHLTDIRLLRMIDADWQDQLASYPREKRVFFGLQLFPEASIDYWIDDLQLIAHEDLLADAAKAFVERGYVVVVKDHPLQFGFRQAGLIERLKALKNVIIVPYEVGGTDVLRECDLSFTCTGTLGLQAALLGGKSIVTENYYSTPEDFIILPDRDAVASLPDRVAELANPTDLQTRQRRIIANLLRGSFVCDFFSFQKFDEGKEGVRAASVGRQLDDHLRNLGWRQ
ncbi:MAG: hypothetical protein QUV71_09365 [Rhizobium sp.]|nr:hypothetical protein [Rhizobium sp.]MDM8013347.1 hypothetical protein [Rhizobium sp.]